MHSRKHRPDDEGLYAVLSEREVRDLHEIELNLRVSDPWLVRRFGELSRSAGSATHRHQARMSSWLPSILLVLAMVVLLAGAVAVNVPVVVAGIAFVVLALGVAAVDPGRPRTA
ncbi:DUF3040 domain-containing protein [Pseudonocardia phyllosphaerae]|uniref:DUF3040 domain-containing protein n=1 Tax=Pseudonocardia phyllosphaerae TaxID=3390502 RepID=UPI003978FB1F